MQRNHPFRGVTPLGNTNAFGTLSLVAKEPVHTMQIPFARHRPSGRYVDATEVPRGKTCDCECPSCNLPLMARQGEQRDWHFAHVTAESDTDSSVCEYSVFVSIRFMAHQILRELDTLRLPCAPGETEREQRTVELEDCEIDAVFQGVKVDALCHIKGAQLALYITHPLREIPAELYDLEGSRVGVLRIALNVLPRFYDQDSVKSQKQQLDRQSLTGWLQKAVEAKSWVYHPRQRQITSPSNQSVADNPTPNKRPVQPAPDTRPLMARYHCTSCDERWIGGYDDESMSVCLRCRRRASVRRVPQT